MFDEKKLKTMRNNKVKLVRNLDRFDLEAEAEGNARSRMKQLQPNAPVGKRIAKMNKGESRGRSINVNKIAKNFAKDHTEVCNDLKTSTNVDYTV